MNATTASTPATTGAPASEELRPADVFVVFGITGDLAKVMTFRSLYRLERRGLLDCPVVGVAGDDWTLEHLRTHARECIAGTGETVD
jgi:glucose-6-phosphate 1-dehydrogenase